MFTNDISSNLILVPLRAVVIVGVRAGGCSIITFSTRKRNEGNEKEETRNKRNQTENKNLFL